MMAGDTDSVSSSEFCTLLPSPQTRILVTHGLSFLPQCDLIVVLDSGRISEVGTYAELIDNNGAFSEFIRTYAAPDENEEGDPGGEHATHICIHMRVYTQSDP